MMVAGGTRQPVVSCSSGRKAGLLSTLLVSGVWKPGTPRKPPRVRSMISKAWHCNAGLAIVGTTPSRIAPFDLLSRGATSMPHAYPTTSNMHAVIDCSAGDNPKIIREVRLRPAATGQGRFRPAFFWNFFLGGDYRWHVAGARHFRRHSGNRR